MQAEIMENAPANALDRIKEAWGSKWVPDEELTRIRDNARAKKEGQPSHEEDGARLEELYGPQGSEVLQSL